MRQLKYEKRCKEAVTTIAAYWHGTQVLAQTLPNGNIIIRQCKDVENEDIGKKVDGLLIMGIH